ncbi:recombinase family protein [Enterobacter hormaechei]
MSSIVNTRIYLRASTKDQDASRARPVLEAFAAERGYNVVRIVEENESGRKMERPLLMSLIEDSKPGDIILIEQIDRLSRMKAADYEELKKAINDKGIRIVSMDLPTSFAPIDGMGEIVEVLLRGINQMMMDVLAAMAAKDYEDRRRRAAQGVAKAKAEGRYRGKPRDEKKRAQILDAIKAGRGFNEIKRTYEVSNCLISSVSKEYRESLEAAKND